METFKSVIYPVRNKLFRFALRLLGDEEEAKDVVQESMIRIWKNRDKLEEISNPEAWCMTVTRNLALDSLRSHQRKHTEPLDAHQVLMAPILDEDESNIEDRLERVAHIISGLPQKYGEIIHLRDIEGYTYEEISEIMDYKMSHVKVSIHRARKMIKEQLVKMESHGS